MYADILQFYEPEKGKSVTRSISALIRALSNRRPYHCRVTLDGEDISGDYLLFEVLNTPAMDTRIRLAPQADSGDGLLEVLRIREDSRNSLLDYLSGLLGEELEELPSVEVSRGRHLEIACEVPFPFHADAVVHLELIPARCFARQIQVQAITDHNEIRGAQKLKEIVEKQADGKTPQLTVIVGEEVSTTEGEIVG